MFRKMLSVLLCIVLGLGCSSSALASDIVDDDLIREPYHLMSCHIL